MLWFLMYFSIAVEILTTSSSEPRSVLCMHAVLLGPGCLFQEYEYEHFAVHTSAVEDKAEFRVKVSLVLKLTV